MKICGRCRGKCVSSTSALRIKGFCARCSEEVFDIADDRGRRMRFSVRQPPPKDSRTRLLEGRRYLWWRGQWRVE